MDSTSCKVHQNIGVSRGGKTTKIHALVNEHFQLIAVDFSEVAIKLLSKITLAGKIVLADKAFCSDEIRKFIAQEKAVACIPDKSNAINLHDFDKELYKARNIIESFFQCIKTSDT